MIRKAIGKITWLYMKWAVIPGMSLIGVAWVGDAIWRFYMAAYRIIQWLPEYSDL